MTDTQHSTPEAGRVAKLLADGDLKAGRNELSERDIADLHAVLAQHADGRGDWPIRASNGRSAPTRDLSRPATTKPRPTRSSRAAPGTQTSASSTAP